MAEVSVLSEADGHESDDNLLEDSSISRANLDKRQQTALWQQSQYMGDSGIHSGVTTKAPSVCGGSWAEDADESFHTTSLEHHLDRHCTITAAGDAEVSDRRVTVTSGAESASRCDNDYDEGDDDEGADFVPVNVLKQPKTDIGLLSVSRSLSMMENAVVNLIDYQDDTDLALCTIPELANLLLGGESIAVRRAALIVHQLTRKETSRNAAVTSLFFVSALVQAAKRAGDVGTLRSLAGAMHNVSHHRQGLLALYRSDGIYVLVRMLRVPEEPVVFYSITTLHNLLLHQDGSKSAVKAAGGVQIMVTLLRLKNPKFLAVLTDCLQILAYSDKDSKRVILSCGGPAELVRVMLTHSYEKLLWTASRVLKVLSICPCNKLAIVEAGGITALATHLRHTSGRLVQNCLWTLRNLSDVATRVAGLDSLLKTLVHLVSSSDPQQAMCAAGILSNLTCNNPQNKATVTRAGGAEALARAMAVTSHVQLLEPIVCALRHLTGRHSDAELAQSFVRLYCGVGVLARLIQPSCPWSLLKAAVGLLKNLAVCSINQVAIQESNVVAQLVHLLFHATSVRRQLQQGTTAASGTSLTASFAMADETIGIAGSALQVLAREPASRAVICQLNTVPVLVELLHSARESVQLSASGILCELAVDESGLSCIERTHAVAPLLQLMESPSEAIASYAAAVLFCLSRRVLPSGSRPNGNLYSIVPLPAQTVAGERAVRACPQNAVTGGTCTGCCESPVRSLLEGSVAAAAAAVHDVPPDESSNESVDYTWSSPESEHVLY